MLLYTVLTGLICLSSIVRAERQAMGYEMTLFYYAYKMESKFSILLQAREITSC